MASKTLEQSKIDLELVATIVEMHVDNMIHTMKGVTKESTKGIMLAHMDAWLNELQTIKYIINTE